MDPPLVFKKWASLLLPAACARLASSSKAGKNASASAATISPRLLSILTQWTLSNPFRRYVIVFSGKPVLINAARLL
jgi:hypothetical protein